MNRSQPSQGGKSLAPRVSETVAELETESETWSSLNTPPKLYASSQHIVSNEVLEILKLNLRLQYTGLVVSKFTKPNCTSDSKI